MRLHDPIEIHTVPTTEPGAPPEIHLTQDGYEGSVAMMMPLDEARTLGARLSEIAGHEAAVSRRPVGPPHLRLVIHNGHTL